MQQELEALSRALEKPERPVAAIVGGAKVSTKLDLLGNLVGKVQLLVVGGGMANTLSSRPRRRRGSVALRSGHGRYGHRHRQGREGQRLRHPAADGRADRRRTEGEHALTRPVSIKNVPSDRMILDVGPATAEHIAKRLGACKTLVWNGPLGAFEFPPFDSGTNLVAEAAADLTRDGRLLTVAGGGDTVAALANAQALERFSYVSTAGGAFLEWLEGKTLPRRQSAAGRRITRCLGQDRLRWNRQGDSRLRRKRHASA